MDETVARIGERELDTPPERIERVEEGLLHETYEIRADGEWYVLQFAGDEDDDEDSLRRGLAWYRRLADSEIPVPQVVTETIQEFEGHQYTLVERLPGTTGERDITPARTRNAGRYLARIHRHQSFETVGWLQVEDGQVSVRPFDAESLRQRRQHSIAWAADTLREAGPDLQQVAARLDALLAEHGDRFPADVDPVLCHDDFSPDNVLFEGDEVVGIIDFDRTRADHAQRDLTAAANAFWMHDPTADWNVRESFYEGYRAVADLDSSFERNEPLYRVETLAWTVASMETLGELSAYEREFYSERLLRAIERFDTER